MIKNKYYKLSAYLRKIFRLVGHFGITANRKRPCQKARPEPIGEILNK